MKLYILRHGAALSESEAKVSRDELRPLAQEGRKDIRRMAEYLKASNARPEIYLTSPLIRAVQTASEAAPVLPPPMGILHFKPLDNKILAEDLYPHLAENFKDRKEVLIIGHLPQLGELVSYLCKQAVNLKTGGIAVVEVANGEGRLLWSKNPEDLPS